MLLSIRDVPPYERHLLFCSNLGQARPRRRRHRGRAINHPLTVCNAPAEAGMVALAARSECRPLAGVA
jgi:hypothetical protein